MITDFASPLVSSVVDDEELPNKKTLSANEELFLDTFSSELRETLLNGTEDIASLSQEITAALDEYTISIGKALVLARLERAFASLSSSNARFLIGDQYNSLSLTARLLFIRTCFDDQLPVVNQIVPIKPINL